MKTETSKSPIALAAVPPYSFRQPGMTPEEAATAAVKALQITHPADALALLWELRRAATNEASNHDTKGNRMNTNEVTPPTGGVR